MVAQSKSVIHLSTVIGEDRKLVVDLPPDTPTGEVDLELTLISVAKPETSHTNPAREAARAKLFAAGALSTVHHTAINAEIPTKDELHRAGTPPPGARSSDQILREIRDED